VYRNGALLGSADYTATNGTTVVLANPASSGDLVETVSFYVSSVLNAIPAVANAVTTSYINDGAVTSAKLANLTTLPTSGGNITLPSVTGTAMVSGNMPAFNAFPSSNQSVTTNTFTLINFQTKTGVGFDTAGAFNNTGSTVTLNGISVPAYAFAPPVAGYYQISVSLAPNTTITREILNLYKNGASAYYGSDITATNISGMNCSWLVYLNGTSDYIQLYGYATGSSPQWFADSRYSFFSGVLVRGA
jgi:hypothetical protein